MYLIQLDIKIVKLTNKMKTTARFSSLKPSTLKAAKVMRMSVEGMRALTTSNKNVPIQYDVAPTPLTN